MAIQRFLDAQNGIYETALSEIHKGKKETHWMWFMFPQIQGLGRSYLAKFYAIKSLSEAKEYLAHDTLRKRLLDISDALMQLDESDIESILGIPDNLKLCSSMTLFSVADAHRSEQRSCPVFDDVLIKYFNGVQCEKTMDLLNRASKFRMGMFFSARAEIFRECVILTRHREKTNVIQV